MADSKQKGGLGAVLFGPDTIEKADKFRVLGIWLSCVSALLVLASAMLLRDVHPILFITLGFGGFYTFVAGEMRRRLGVEMSLEKLRAEVLDLRRAITQLQQGGS